MFSVEIRFMQLIKEKYSDREEKKHEQKRAKNEFVLRASRMIRPALFISCNPIQIKVQTQRHFWPV